MCDFLSIFSFNNLEFYVVILQNDIRSRVQFNLISICTGSIRYSLYHYHIVIMLSLSYYHYNQITVIVSYCIILYPDDEQNR